MTEEIDLDVIGLIQLQGPFFVCYPFLELMVEIVLMCNCNAGKCWRYREWSMYAMIMQYGVSVRNIYPSSTEEVRYKISINGIYMSPSSLLPSR